MMIDNTMIMIINDEPAEIAMITQHGRVNNSQLSQNMQVISSLSLLSSPRPSVTPVGTVVIIVLDVVSSISIALMQTFPSEVKLEVGVEIEVRL